MVRNQAIPRNLDVEGFRVKISYYGQAVECDNCERLGHFARDCPLKENACGVTNLGTLQECVNPRAYSSDIPDDGPADTPLVATRSEVAQPTPPADSYNVSNDSATSVSSHVLLDSADVVSTYVQVCMQMRKLRFLRKIAKIVNCAKKKTNPQLGLAILAKIAIFATFRKIC